MGFAQNRPVPESVAESESESESTLNTDSGVGVNSDKNPTDSAALVLFIMHNWNKCASNVFAARFPHGATITDLLSKFSLHIVKGFLVAQIVMR